MSTQLQEVLIGQHEDGFADVHDHANGRQGCLEILRMRRPNGDRHSTDVQATNTHVSPLR
ncbi:hypothetical protein X777_13397 [Ooceraea biroi]|uniref:Uncharacterized protein n=1 Tax=Ooceraea biroi TaxID=2015173 RepID=A0A026WWU8_OOCBI|nr:hypothetical protein X777_13397 [Ooceraea biroi]